MSILALLGASRIDHELVSRVNSFQVHDKQLGDGQILEVLVFPSISPRIVKVAEPPVPGSGGTATAEGSKLLGVAVGTILELVAMRGKYSTSRMTRSSSVRTSCRPDSEPKSARG